MISVPCYLDSIAIHLHKKSHYNTDFDRSAGWWQPDTSTELEPTEYKDLKRKHKNDDDN